MNIAEIRKKSKKKKEEKIERKEPLSATNLEEKASNLPIPALEEKSPAEVNSPLETNFELIDEENLYRKYSFKETKAFKEYLCFMLGEEEYGIEVHYVKEVIKNRPLTEVPKTLDFILGVVAIRGEVIPVFDFKKILDITATVDSLTAKLIILEVKSDKIALVADAITQIGKIASEDINPTPINITGAKQEFINGIAIKEGRMIRLLDIEKMLNF